jgi:arylsulfatase A-like enzyme
MQLPDSIWGQEGKRKLRMVQDHAIYAAMVEAMDLAVGIVLDKLEELGLSDNTIIFLMSDNGGLSTSEGHPTSNLPLRAGKGWLYEGGIREPMLIKWPEVTTPGEVVDVPVISTDFFPTILEMADIPLPEGIRLDGMSMVPLLKGKSNFNRNAIFWHYPHYGNQGGTPGAAVRKDNYKYIEFFENKPGELYDLSKDISEENDLSEKMPEKVNELKNLLYSWQEETKARFPSENLNFNPEKQEYY